MLNHKVAFIGAGATNISAIYELVKKLESSSNVLRFLNLEIDVYDVRSENFWGGRAYKEVASEMLFFDDFENLITRSRGNYSDLINQFYSWVAVNADRWVQLLKEEGSPKTQEWLAEYEPKIKERNFYNMKVPRALLGIFMDEVFISVLERAKKLGVSVNVLEGEVESIRLGEKNKSICHFKKPAQRLSINIDDKKVSYSPTGETLSTIEANDVVLSNGFAQRTRFEHLEHLDNYYPQHLDTINGRKPDLKKQILEIYARTGQPVRIGAIGSGASFMDIIIHLDDPHLRDKVHVTCYSLHGGTPIASDHDEDLSKFKPKHILPEKRFTDMSALNEALQAEIANAKEQGFTRAAAYYKIKHWAEANKNSPIINDVEAFIKKFKFCSLDAARSREKLEVSEVAVLLKPEELQASGDKIEIKHPKFSFTDDIIINCSGVGGIDKHPIISDLISSGQVKAGKTGALSVIELDENLKARDGLHIGGTASCFRKVGGSEAHFIPNVNQCIRDGDVIANSLFENMRSLAMSEKKSLMAEIL